MTSIERAPFRTDYLKVFPRWHLKLNRKINDKTRHSKVWDVLNFSANKIQHQHGME